MYINNEIIGISMEIAIAKAFCLSINKDYEKSSDILIVNKLLKDINFFDIFDKNKIPYPKKHVAENQNPVDFILYNNKTLSVKTNKGKLGKVAPQIIGQPTSETYFSYLENNYKDEIYIGNISDNYSDKSDLFKKISIENIDKIINIYWENLFDCDYYLHFFNFNSGEISYLLLKKEKPPIWNKENFSFTQSFNSWNESNTVKYCGISIGEFQVHKNRNCFKFRFNMNGIIKLFENKYLKK